MKTIDGIVLALLVLVGVVAFLNHGSLGLSTNPQGSGFSINYK